MSVSVSTSIQPTETTAKEPSEPTTVELVAKTVAGIAQIGSARAALEQAGYTATITSNRITVNNETEAQLISANGSAWWNVYAADGSPPVWTVGTKHGDHNWAGAE